MYVKLFPTLISDWRAKWQEGNFPFLFVQISSFTSTGFEGWGVIRDAQRRTLDLTNTGMAVSLDVGAVSYTHLSDIFPTGFHGAVTAGVEVGSTVYIAGAGPVGLAAAASAQLLGAAEMCIRDRRKTPRP